MGTVSVNERIRQIAKNADLRGETTQNRTDTPLQDKTPSETNTGRLQGIADSNAKLRRHYKAVLDEYSENRRRAGDLRKEIAIGSREGDDLLTLFEKAIKCIECMTGDKAFYNSVMKNVNSR